MSQRSDIEPRRDDRRLSYTRRCGWVDWGHARPGAALSLKRQMETEQGDDVELRSVDLTLEGAPAYVLSFGEEMRTTAFGMTLRASTEHAWVVKKGLLPAVREEVALGIFLKASYEFERMQSSVPYRWRTDSGFSVEDLASDLIGFYIAFRGFTMDQMRNICGEVSVKESYRIWDRYTPHGIGSLKNYTAKPHLFPTTEGVYTAADIAFPPQLATIRPAPGGGDWVSPERGVLDSRLVQMKAKINVSKVGRVGAAAPGSIAVPSRSQGRPADNRSRQWGIQPVLRRVRTRHVLT